MTKNTASVYVKSTSNGRLQHLKAGSYLRGEPFSGPFPQILNWIENTCKYRNTLAFQHRVTQKKRFYNICNWCQCYKNSRVSSRPYKQTLAQAGKACQGQNSTLLRIIVNYGLKKYFITLTPGEIFLNFNLLELTNFCKKLECLVLPANIRLCWRGLPGTNTLAY